MTDLEFINEYVKVHYCQNAVDFISGKNIQEIYDNIKFRWFIFHILLSKTLNPSYAMNKVIEYLKPLQDNIKKDNNINGDIINSKIYEENFNGMLNLQYTYSNLVSKRNENTKETDYIWLLTCWYEALLRKEGDEIYNILPNLLSLITIYYKKYLDIDKEQELINYFKTIVSVDDFKKSFGL